MNKIIIAGIKGYLGNRSKIFFKKKGFKVYDYKKKIPKTADIILNVSGPPQSFCENYPKKTRFFRAKMNKKLIRLAKKKGVKIFFYISTMHVYKDAKFLSPNSKIFNKNQYSISHINGEKEIIRSSKKNKNILFKILRLTNCIGVPHKKKCNSWKLLINDLCKQATTKNKIRIYSKTNTSRDFITIDYFLNSLLSIIKNKNNNLIMNISSEKSIPILTIAKKIKRRFFYIFNKKIKILHNTIYPEKKGIVISSLKKKFKNNFTQEIDSTLIYANKIFK